MSLNDLSKEIHAIAVEKGWWPVHEEPWLKNERPFPEVIALIHSEASEALEEYRNGHSPQEIYLTLNGKPEGIPIEIADIIIRCLDYCGKEDIDIDFAMKKKIEYNRSRPFRHGNKKA